MKNVIFISLAMSCLYYQTYHKHRDHHHKQVSVLEDRLTATELMKDQFISPSRLTPDDGGIINNLLYGFRLTSI